MEKIHSQEQSNPSVTSNPSLTSLNPDKKSDKNDRIEEKIIKTVERILLAEQHRNATESSRTRLNFSVGPLTDHDLSDLSMLCTLVSSNSNLTKPVGFSCVELDLLQSLLELLQKHVNMAVNLDLVQEACKVITQESYDSSERYSGTEIDIWLSSSGIGSNRISILQQGIAAASTILSIITSPGIERKVINEDSIDAAITLLRHNLSKNIIPCLNNTGHITAIRSELKSANHTTPSKKRRRTALDKGNIVMRELRKVYMHIESSIGLHLLLMERIEQLIHLIPLDDQKILTLTAGALNALEIDASYSKGTSHAHLLQIATINLITSTFQKYPTNRSIILEDLFPLMLRLPSGKKSSRTFPIRYATCPCPGGSQLMTSSLFSSILPNGQNPHYIQVMSALILSIVQSCVVRPTYESTVDEKDDMQDENQISTALASGLKDCQIVCESFAVQMLQRCSRRGGDGGASEFRPVLSNLIDDLLLVILIPEYAASEMMILTFSNLLSRDVLRASLELKKSKSSATTESTYLNTAFDILGRFSEVQARILAASREKPINLLDDDIAAIHDMEDTINSQNNHLPNTLMIDCDRCHKWFDAHLVGLTRETIPSKWYCDACQLTRILENEGVQNLYSGGTQRKGLDKTYAASRVLASHLFKISKDRDDAGDVIALKFFLAKWTENLDKEGRPAKADNVVNNDSGIVQNLIVRILEKWDGIKDSRGDEAQLVVLDRSNNNFALTEEGNIRIILYLRATDSTFVQTFRNRIGLLLGMMSDKSSSNLRKLSVRAIEKVVEADPKVMLMQVVMKAVRQRFADESISVREAVISLVGSYVARSPNVANAFHASFLSRLADPGVSVRKRTVRILQEILCSNPNYEGRYAACNQLLQRSADPKEDDGVRDSIHILFLKLWLEDGDKIFHKHENTDNPNQSDVYNNPSCDVSVVTPTDSQHLSRSRNRNGSTKFLLRSEIAAKQMVEVVKIADTGEHLGVFLKDLLCEISDVDSGKKVSERRRRQQVAQKHCSRLVDALFEQLLSTEEKRAEIGSGVAKQIIATMRTIGVLTEVSPTPVLRHLDTVLPYLKADNGFSREDESVVITVAADILFRLISFISRNDMERFGTGFVGNDLVSITYSFGSGAILSATRALAALAHHQKAREYGSFGKQLLQLCRTFYVCLFKKEKEDLASLSAKATNNIQRALCTLGFACRYHEMEIESSLWDEEVDNNELELVKPVKLSLCNLPVACYRLFIIYLEKGHVATKCSALRALGGIFGAHPRLMLAMEQSGLIDDIMSDDSHIDLQIESLRCWKDILLAEEKRVESGDAKAKMDSKEEMTTSKRISGDQDSDATIVGGVLTKHAARLFELTQSKHQLLRFTSLDLIVQLLRQGMLNPNEAVPYLFALQGDIDDVTIRSLALKFLILEGDKRPDMIRQRVCAGVKQACNFQQKLYPERETSALIKVNNGNEVSNQCVFGSVYLECIINSQKQREGLFKNLLGLFEETDTMERMRPNKKTTFRGKVKRNAKTSRFDLPLLSYASQILAHLPYNKPGDPLFIIYQINTIVALQGSQLLDRAASFLRPFGLSTSDEYDENIAEEDQLEIAAKQNNPICSEEASSLKSPEFDWNHFNDLCRYASAIVLLLRLKKYLRKAFNFTETRIIEYNPSAKERSFGKSIHRAETMKPFDSSLIMTGSKAKTNINRNFMVRQYAEFRRLMRVELSADSPMNDVDGELEKVRKRSDSMSDEEV